MPRLYDAHSGGFIPQSAHSSLPVEFCVDIHRRKHGLRGQWTFKLQTLLTFLFTEVCKCSPILVNHRVLSAELATHLQQGSLLDAHSQLPESQVRTTGRAIASHALKPTFRHREKVCFLASELFLMYHNTLICMKYFRLALLKFGF